MDLNVLPPDLFTAGVPGPMQDQVPHVVDGPDGAMWSLAGTTLGPSGRRGKGLVDSNDPGYRPGPSPRPSRRHGPRRHLHPRRLRPAVGLPHPRPRGARRVHARVQRLGRGIQRGEPRPARRARAPAVALAGVGARGARALRRARAPRRDPRPARERRARVRRRVGRLLGHGQRARAADQLPPRQGHAQHCREARELAAAGRGRGVAVAARRDAHRHDLLRHPGALPERAHRARRGRARLGALPARAARPRAREVPRPHLRRRAAR